MQIPEAFKDFASLFDLDLHDHAPNEQQMVAFAIKHTSDTQKRTVKAYLDELLRRDVSGTELQKIWVGSGASLSIPNNAELRRLLRMISEELD
jgi:hypothetical protein